jgi:hypothetical protein
VADRRFLAGLAAGCAAAGAFWLGSALWSHWTAPGAPAVRAVSSFQEPAAAVAPEAGPAEVPPPPAPTPEPELPPTPPPGAATRLELPVYDKLVAAPLSREPHQVLGAWDEDREGVRPGARRAFVLVVSPGQSDASLETLARDVRAQNLDALILDVRVYDDAGAALGPRVIDSGQAARAHLVAEVKRNLAANLDSLRVRGRDLAP